MKYRDISRRIILKKKFYFLFFSGKYVSSEKSGNFWEISGNQEIGNFFRADLRRLNKVFFTRVHIINFFKSTGLERNDEIILIYVILCKLTTLSK